MIFKRIIYALLYSKGYFHLSRNFTLQRVGDVSWLKNNFGFGDTCDYIDELIIINVTNNPSEKEQEIFFKNVNELREKVFVPLTIGGGIRSIEDAKKFFKNGADKILINYLAHADIKECEKIAKVYGQQAISIMVDIKKKDMELYSFINSGQKISYSLKNYFLKISKIKFGDLILNSIDNDGTGIGFNLETLKNIPNNFKKPILLMGGAGKPEHFEEALNAKEVSGVITANLFNFLGKGLEESRNYSIERNIRLVKF